MRAVDWSDNFDITAATYDWEVDLTVVEEGNDPEAIPPDTRIASGPDPETLSDSATFRFAGSDNATPGLALIFECSLNGADFAPCTTPTNYTGLALGDHTF